MDDVEGYGRIVELIVKGVVSIIGVLAAVVLLEILIVRLLVAGYIFRAMALGRIAGRMGCGQGWIAWIPVANNLLLGRLAFGRYLIGAVLTILPPLSWWLAVGLGLEWGGLWQRRSVFSWGM